MRYLRRIIYGGFALALAIVIAYPLLAATYNNNPTLLLAPRVFMVTLTNANSTTPQSLAVCGSGPGLATKISSLIAMNTDNNTYTLVISLNNGGSVPFLDVTVPASAGASPAVVPLNIIGPSTTLAPGLPNDGFGPYLLCQSGTTIFVDTTTAVAASRDINVIAQGGDF